MKLIVILALSGVILAQAPTPVRSSATIPNRPQTEYKKTPTPEPTKPITISIPTQDGKAVTVALSVQALQSFAQGATAAGGAATYPDVAYYIARLIGTDITQGLMEHFPTGVFAAEKANEKASRDKQEAMKKSAVTIAAPQ